MYECPGEGGPARKPLKVFWPFSNESFNKTDWDWQNGWLQEKSTYPQEVAVNRYWPAFILEQGIVKTIEGFASGSRCPTIRNCWIILARHLRNRAWT